MPKITGQNVPPSLLALYTRLVSPGKVTQGADGSLRLKKGKKKPKKTPPESLDLGGFQRIAEIVANVYFTQQSKPIPANFVFNLTQDLLLGVVPGKYFTRCKLQSAVTLESIPTSVPDPNPPPYGFRTNQFLPTIPTYPDGSSTSDPPGYYGEKVALRFEDKWLRWKKWIFKAWAFSFPEGAERVLLIWDCTISINTAARGSRPMVSLNLKTYQGGITAPAIASTTPPIQKKTNLYWRFPPPPSGSPFYHSSQVRRVVKPMARLVKNSGAAPFKYFILDGSNRPMMGRGYNNNNTVQTSLTGDPVLWEVKPPCIAWNPANYTQWKWAAAPDELWTASINFAYVTFNANNTATVHMSVRLTLDGTTHDIVKHQLLTGAWSWWYFGSGTMADGTLPYNCTLRLRDVSCLGDKVIFQVLKPYMSAAEGALGFLQFEITSDSTGDVTVLADVDACEAKYYTINRKTYGIFGDQPFEWFYPPKTVQVWFDDEDGLVTIQWQEYTLSEYPYNSGFTEFRLSRNGTVESIYRDDSGNPLPYTANLDGYSDGGRIQGGLSMMSVLDRSRTLQMSNPIWTCRYVKAFEHAFYASVGQLPNEYEWPNGYAELTPDLSQYRIARIRLDVYHLITQSYPGPYPMGGLPAYIRSDTYKGWIVGTSETIQQIEHTTA